MVIALPADPASAPQPVPRAAPETRAHPRERIISAAYELFCRRGTRAVGVEELMARAEVAKATFYRHFPSKDELVLAVLRDREQRWTHDTVRDGAQSRGSTPRAWLLGIFDVFDEWFHSGADFEACTFINVLVEVGAEHPAGRAAIVHLAAIRAIVADWAALAGLRDPDGFAYSWHILMKGSIISATEGDLDAARRAQGMARQLIEDHTPPPAAAPGQTPLLERR